MSYREILRAKEKDLGLKLSPPPCYTIKGCSSLEIRKYHNGVITGKRIGKNKEYVYMPDGEIYILIGNKRKELGRFMRLWAKYQLKINMPD